MHLREVFTRWSVSAARTHDTTRACERALALFEEFTKDTPISRLTRQQGDGFRAWLQEHVIDTVVGHEVNGSTGAKVYTHRSLSMVRNAVEKLRYPGLDLQRVFPAGN